MSTTNFNTNNQTFRQLLGNGLNYTVPIFQRDYSWTAEEWEDLWMDIEAMYEPDGEEAHYMGYLVLQSSDQKNFKIVDGQQRIATLSIIILAALATFREMSEAGEAPDENRRRMEQFRSGYIGYLDPVTLVPQSKLHLNRHNDKFYQDYLVPLIKLPQRGLNSSEHALRKAFHWFFDRIKRKANKSGENLARFLDSLVDRLFFTVITVSDELNAFKVFETLNARGVRLSATDLLKNYLFSIIYKEGAHETEIRNLEDRWERIVTLLGNENFPEFLRVYWNSRNRLVRKTELFKVIRSHVKERKTAFELIRELENCAYVYSAIREPNDTLWNAEECSHLVNLRLYNIRQHYPLMLAAFRIWGENNRSDFTKVLRYLDILSFRYNVICNFQTNEQERLYNQIAIKLSEELLQSPQAVKESLRTLYPDDSIFQAALEKKTLVTTNSRNRRIVRKMLFVVENHLTGQKLDEESDRYNLEHILPEHPTNEEWPDYNENTEQDFIHRLGNMTLIETSLNRDIGNSSYQVKKKSYAKSVFAHTQKVAEDYNTWNSDKIVARQNWLSKQVVALWRINY